MRTIYTNLFALLLILIVSSCSTTYNDFTDLELEEWQLYTQNESLFFTDKYGQIDTFKVASVLGSWNESGDVYDESVTATFIKLNDKIAENQAGFLNLQKDGDAIIASIRWPHHRNTLVLTGTPQLPFFPYKNDTLFDVWRSVAPPVYIDSTNAYIDTVYYSKEFGFIKFTDIFNNEFTKLN